jgi:hypothetical protein
MKTNKKQISAEEKFANKIAEISADYYKTMLEKGIDLSKAKVKKMKVSDIKMSGLRHEKLPEGFIKRVIEYKKILKEVEQTSLEEAVSNFQRDLNPESELVIWEAIANFYQGKLKDYPKASLEDKKEVFKKALLYTMG